MRLFRFPLLTKYTKHFPISPPYLPQPQEVEIITTHVRVLLRIDVVHYFPLPEYLLQKISSEPAATGAPSGLALHICFGGHCASCPSILFRSSLCQLPVNDCSSAGRCSQSISDRTLNLLFAGLETLFGPGAGEPDDDPAEEEQDGDEISVTADDPDLMNPDQIPDDAHCKEEVQQDGRQVESGVIGNVTTGQRRNNHSSVGKDHAEDKAHKDHMQQGVVERTGHRDAVPESCQARENEPAVSGQQTEGTVSRPLHRADSASGDIVPDQPDGRENQQQTGDTPTGLNIQMVPDRGADPPQTEHGKELDRPSRRSHDAVQFETFTENGEQRKADPPDDDRMNDLA